MKRFDILIRCRRAFQFRSLKNNTQITAMIYPNRNRLSVKRAKHELRRMKSSESPNRKGRSEWKKKFKKIRTLTKTSHKSIIWLFYLFVCCVVFFFLSFFFPTSPLLLYTFQLSVVKSKFIISTNQSIREFLKEPTRSRCKNKLLEAR